MYIIKNASLMTCSAKRKEQMKEDLFISSLELPKANQCCYLSI